MYMCAFYAFIYVDAQHISHFLTITIGQVARHEFCKVQHRDIDTGYMDGKRHCGICIIFVATLFCCIFAIFV